MQITIRSYQKKDYKELKKVYQNAGWYDPETDQEERLDQKIKRDPESILVASEDEQILGTLSIIEDGRVALFFRFLVIEHKEAQWIRTQLLETGQEILKKRGYKEVHIIAPEDDLEKHKEYENYGFKKGNPYRWFFKNI